MMDNTHKADDASGGDLFGAAQRGEVDRVTALLAAADTREITVQKEMHGALQIAIRNDFPAVVRVLCAAGAHFCTAGDHIGLARWSWNITFSFPLLLRTNAAERSDFQPIHLAASVGSASCIAELASQFQAHAGARDTDGDTPLHWASRFAHADAIRELLAVKARVGDYNDHWVTPLDVATTCGHIRCVKVLAASRQWKKADLLRAVVHTQRHRGRNKRCADVLARALRLHTQSAKTVE